MYTFHNSYFIFFIIFIFSYVYIFIWLFNYLCIYLFNYLIIYGFIVLLFYCTRREDNRVHAAAAAAPQGDDASDASAPAGCCGACGACGAACSRLKVEATFACGGKLATMAASVRGGTIWRRSVWCLYRTIKQ